MSKLDKTSKTFRKTGKDNVRFFIGVERRILFWNDSVAYWNVVWSLGSYFGVLLKCLLLKNPDSLSSHSSFWGKSWKKMLSVDVAFLWFELKVTWPMLVETILVFLHHWTCCVIFHLDDQFRDGKMRSLRNENHKEKRRFVLTQRYSETLTLAMFDHIISLKWISGSGGCHCSENEVDTSDKRIPINRWRMTESTRMGIPEQVLQCCVITRGVAPVDRV